jgi:TP901-1 family phage major tail protein
MSTVGESVLNGTKMLLYVGGIAIAGATSHTLSLNMDTRESTNKDSQGWRELLESVRSWTVSGEGLKSFDAAYGHDDLAALYVNRTPVVVKLSTEQSGETYYEGSAFLTSIDADFPNEDNSTFSFTFEGTGPLVATGS